MKSIPVYLSLILLLFACKTDQTIVTDDTPSIFSWLNEEADIIRVEIRGDLDHLFAAQHQTDHFHPANIQFTKRDGTFNFDIQLSRRGVTRRKICDFPPIKLKFPKAILARKGFSSFSSYKLVTHCMEGEDDLILKEYLTYQLFNQLTEKSFKVKLAKIRYIDESGKIPADEHYGFFIEGNKEMASRLNGTLIDPAQKKITQVDKEQYKKLVLFQYMIANTDWNLSKGHNIKWVQTETSDVPSPVPYDFDYCGLVNAPYAVPHPQMPIKNVRERFLQWRGKNKEALLPICEEFKGQKAAFLQVCEGFESLSADTKTEMMQFLESFFKELENQTFLLSNPTKKTQISF